MPNQLIREKSPYLLQHAHNPVDWHPWSEAAFEKARSENKPIFLSIGYSTCHWCHVMEHESFENDTIAKILNENFISIKVDREERPDVDQVYMQAVMAMSGAGGWPMSVFLTPDRNPFYGGTYFPPEDSHGRPGFKALINLIAEKWKADTAAVFHSSKHIAQVLNEELNKPQAPRELSELTLKKALEQFHTQFDARYGGFGGAPKFPRSHAMNFLLRAWKRFNDSKALDMVEQTLAAMVKGGIFDHLGGGFHRYSTDEVWHVPHFEKMLYDQALISRTYLEAFQATGKKVYAETVKAVFDYVLRDMTDAGGGFYSAEDADSENPEKPGIKSEGAFYLWSQSELFKILGEDRGKLFAYHFDIHENGNATYDPHAEFSGKNILRVTGSLEDTAKHFKKDPAEVRKILEEAKGLLFRERLKRPKPHLDDKILTDWNALMIAALTYGGRILGEARYVQVAQKAADFILKKMKRADGRLMHRFRDGEVAIPGFLEDYAFLSCAFLDLYEATFEPRYFEEAIFLGTEMIRLFWDTQAGGFFLTADDAEKLYTQLKEIYDGAIPAGNSMAAMALIRLARFTGGKAFEQKANEVFQTFSAKIADFPSGHPQMMAAFDMALGPTREIVIAAEKNDAAVCEILNAVNAIFYPNQVVIFRDRETVEKMEKLIPFIKNQTAINGKPTVYICKNHACDLPLTEFAQLAAALRA